jgi:hypothetical protein
MLNKKEESHWSFDIDDLYVYVMGLDYYQDLEKETDEVLFTIENEKEEFYNRKRLTKITYNNVKYKQVPRNFSDEQNYFNDFKKLFYLEVKAHIIRRFCQISKAHEISFVSLKQEKRFCFCTFKMGASKEFEVSSSDLVLITKDDPNNEQELNFIGIVEFSEDSNIIIKAYFDHFNPKNAKIKEELQAASTWHIKSLLNFSTFEREWVVS